jgi:cytochrome c-type biogenesis protein CcmH/NrfG
MIWPTLRAKMGPRRVISETLPQARDVYAGAPSKNARPGVAYVGDAACARCHREISESYRSHPMGRSLAPVSDVKNGPPTHGATRLPIEEKGAEYTIEHRDGKVFHKATRRDADGKVYAEIEAEVRYALGSGTRGIAYLIERDGFLFQSPIAWFAQQSRWGISPGYGEFTARPSFERPIEPGCLYCHANQVHAVTGTRNRYETPIFQGYAIGCERCHGPGELHVKGGGLSSESDSTIVNPADLTPPLRDAVCQQCHLQGSLRFARAGREIFDYRPGLPIHPFHAVFIQKQGNRDRFEAVGHVEQMEASRCFAASAGQLGCISCHDPHLVPAPETKVAYYRERCLACHENMGCAFPLAQRQARGQGEDCIACHMPRPSITNIPHTAATDHRIPRGVPRSAPERPRDAAGQPGEFPLVDFHWALMTPEERRDGARDTGVALGWAARNLRASPPFARLAATRALPLLEASLRDRPDDLQARELLGHAFAILDHPEDALGAFEAVLQIQPGRESALRAAGGVLAALQRPDRARAALEKAIAVNPWPAEYHRALAAVCASAGDWPAAVAACRKALELNPELFEARSLLVQCYLRCRQSEKADAEFQILVRYYPAGREAWEEWYEQEKKAARGGVDLRTPAGGRVPP